MRLPAKSYPLPEHQDPTPQARSPGRGLREEAQEDSLLPPEEKEGGKGSTTPAGGRAEALRWVPCNVRCPRLPLALCPVSGLGGRGRSALEVVFCGCLSVVDVRDTPSPGHAALVAYSCCRAGGAGTGPLAGRFPSPPLVRSEVSSEMEASGCLCPAESTQLGPAKCLTWPYSALPFFFFFCSPSPFPTPSI